MKEITIVIISSVLEFLTKQVKGKTVNVKAAKAACEVLVKHLDEYAAAEKGKGKGGGALIDGLTPTDTKLADATAEVAEQVVLATDEDDTEAE